MRVGKTWRDEEKKKLLLHVGRRVDMPSYGMVGRGMSVAVYRCPDSTRQDRGVNPVLDILDRRRSVDLPLMSLPADF